MALFFSSFNQLISVVSVEKGGRLNLNEHNIACCPWDLFNYEVLGKTEKIIFIAEDVFYCKGEEIIDLIKFFTRFITSSSMIFFLNVGKQKSEFIFNSFSGGRN